jgi:DNA-3-methyladenine glycosylase
MFARGGCVYIYFIYGMHYCLNIVTEEEGRGSAVLLRSAEPLEGQELMAARRFKNRPPEKGGEGLLTCGPGRLAGALGLNREHDGLGLNEGFLLLRDDGWTPPRRLASSPRIGITKAPEKRLRWYLPDSPWVSGQRGGRG